MKAPLAATIGPYSISPTHPLNPSMSVKDRRPDHNTGNYVPFSCEQCVGSLTSHKVIMNKGCETGPTIYRPYPRRLESLTICICRCYYKGSTFSLDPECWSGRGLNPRPPAREPGALPTEPTGRGLNNNNRVTVAVTSVEVNFTSLVASYCKSRKKAPRFIVEIVFELLDLLLRCF